eukprot:TRINITY_DN23932_c0_g1_i1.p1 TRINITY_DN23932_c0_g1~~TRINITY_DN23932_c0_g1_i1.p1  ORF type:complete len:319 (+),score=129.87 TRINITY_DN23932_c0_g1_i1:86-1042(+)
MSGAESTHRNPKKVAYFARLEGYLAEYARVLVVEADNVGSKQMQDVRLALRGRAEVLMGKNTQIRKVLRNAMVDNPNLEALLKLVRGNIGFVFTNEPAADIRKEIQSFKKGALARAGAVAPCSVAIPSGNTGLEPAQTSFFQAMNIPTKITKGTIEVLTEYTVVHEGEKVGSSQAILLKKLGIMPFEYGLKVSYVYEDGTVFGAEVLDITDDDLKEHLLAGISNIAAVSLATGVPTLASFPHSVLNAYVNLCAISIETSYTFKGTEKIKALLADPEALAAAQAAAAAAPAAGGSGGGAAAAAPEPEEESDEDMGFDLF